MFMRVFDVVGLSAELYNTGNEIVHGGWIVYMEFMIAEELRIWC